MKGISNPQKANKREGIIAESSCLSSVMKLPLSGTRKGRRPPPLSAKVFLSTAECGAYAPKPGGNTDKGLFVPGAKYFAPGLF